jgi:hypothetical protein
MKFLMMVWALSFSASVMAEEQIFIGRTLLDNKDCSFTIVDIKLNDDGTKIFRVKSSFTGSGKIRTLSNLVKTSDTKFTVSANDIDNTFTENSREFLSARFDEQGLNIVQYKRGKKTNFCQISR